jgi:RHH-type rel operon transcriptional repressor/antitoxin RelB
MTSSAPLSVRLPENLRDDLDALAKATRRSKAFIVKEAVESYVAAHRSYVAAIDDAVREADAGAMISQQATEDWLSRWGRDDEGAVPEPDIRPFGS